MNAEILQRAREAKKYQMMAVKALFPNIQNEHMKVIEKEIKAMLMEGIMDCMSQCMAANATGAEKETKETADGDAHKEAQGGKKKRKVTID